MALIRDRQRKSTTFKLGDRDIPVSSWEEPGVLGNVSQDASGVVFFKSAEWQDEAEVLRLIVADGITPVENVTPSFDGIDGAAFAAQLAVRNARLPLSPHETALKTNLELDHLMIGSRLTRRQRMQTTLHIVDIVATIDNQWSIHVFNAGDSTSRVLIENTWVDLIQKGGYKASQIALLREQRRENPHASLREMQDLEDVYLATPDHFESTPLGSFPNDVCIFNEAIHAVQPSFGLLVFSDGLREPKHFDYNQILDQLEYMSDPTTDTTSISNVKGRDDITVLSVGDLAPTLTQ